MALIFILILVQAILMAGLIHNTLKIWLYRYWRSMYEQQLVDFKDVPDVRDRAIDHALNKNRWLYVIIPSWTLTMLIVLTFLELELSICLKHF